MSANLTSFGGGLNVAVIGATGGIGSAFVRLLSGDPAIANLFALSRTEAADLPANAHPLKIDIEDEASIAEAADQMKQSGPLHIVIVASGHLHDGALQPEKSWSALSAPAMEAAFRVNAIGPSLVAKHVLPIMARDRKTVFAALSARVGSISDNRLGGWYAYRASKAALNQILKCLAIEWARKTKHGAVLGLHPGTVDTDLSQPFQGNVPEGKLFTADFAAAKLLRVIDRYGASESGNIYAWDGACISP